MPPGTAASATVLTAGTWADGNITSSDGEWFKFTATASTQYIHASSGTLYYLYVRLYNSGGNTVDGNWTNLYGSTTYFSLTIGQEYFIWVTPYSSSDRGTYGIMFNTKQ
jgi:hypothetical protein